MVKYIIALLAVNPQIYINEAQNLFSNIAQGYLLSSSSQPHVTLAQFYAEEATCKNIVEDLKEIKDIPHPNFSGISFIKDKENLDVWWAELSISRNPNLILFQKSIVDILNKYKIKCINDINELYRPHLTLARVNRCFIANFNMDLLKDSNFIIALGRADDLGQFIETLCEFV